MLSKRIGGIAVVSALLIGGLSRTGWAVSYAGGGFNIADNATQIDTIVVPDSAVITDVTVSLLGLTHTWIGDLVVTLTHVDTGTTVDLFRRVGRISAIISSLGDSSNLNGDYNFNDAFTGDLWATAASGVSTFNIPGGDYFPSSQTDGVGESASSFSPFLGQNTLGSWTLSITDSAGGDIGALQSWRLSFEVEDGQTHVIPEPATAGLAMLGLGSLAGAFLRRRRA